MTRDMMVAMKQTTLRRALVLGVAALPGTALAAAPLAPSAAPPATPPPLVASLHLQRVDTVLTALRSYVPVPISPQDVFKDLVGDFNKLVSLTAPIDVVVALDPAAGENLERPLWGFSVGLTSAEDARLLAQSRGYITDGKLGSFRLSVPVTPGGRGLFCYLTTATGGTGRLSCSGRDRDRDLLGPYLSRLVPSAAAQATDLHAELLIDTLTRTYQGPWQRVLQRGAMALPQRLALGQPKFDRAVTDATQALIGELGAISRDLQLLALDVALQPSGAQLQLGYRLAGQESVWAQYDAEVASRPVSGAPAAFWALPGDVTAASFRSTNPKWAQRLLQLLWPILDGYLEHEALAPADRQALGDLLIKIPKFDGPLNTVLAEGPSDATAKGEDAAALLGGTFYLTTSEGAADQSVTWLRAVAEAYNRPGVQAYLKKKWKAAGQTDPLPTLRAENVTKQLGPGAVGLAFTANLAGLNKAAGKLNAGATPAAGGTGAAAKKPLTTIYLFSTTTGNHVWTALGTDRATLLRRLLETP